MAQEKFYSLIILVLSLKMFSDINELFEPFKAEINIEKKDYYSNQTISKGLISFQDNKFIYQLNDPMNQTIYGLKNQLIVQDNDFKQVMIYDNKYNFLLSKVFDKGLTYEPISCLETCFKAIINNESIKTSTVTAVNNKLVSMQIVDNQNQVFLIKFSNLVYESTNINYVTPNGYQVIKND
mgnify:FL=1